MIDFTFIFLLISRKVISCLLKQNFQLLICFYPPLDGTDWNVQWATVPAVIPSVIFPSCCRPSRTWKQFLSNWWWDSSSCSGLSYKYHLDYLDLFPACQWCCVLLQRVQRLLWHGGDVGTPEVQEVRGWERGQQNHPRLNGVQNAGSYFWQKQIWSKDKESRLRLIMPVLSDSVTGLTMMVNQLLLMSTFSSGPWDQSWRARASSPSTSTSDSTGQIAGWSSTAAKLRN